MAFINFLYHLSRSYASKSHRCADLFVNAGTTRVPARLGKGQGAKEIGHNLVRERHIIGHSLEHE